ncbi:MAG: hypothetical protein ACU837_08955 [Gammaproteobacteria bacterium]
MKPYCTVLLVVMAVFPAQRVGADDVLKRVSIPLKPVPADEPAAALPATICARLPTPCDPASSRVYTSNALESVGWYLIDASKPMLAALDAKAPDDTGLARYWDFSAYRHAYAALADAEAEEPLQVYPALYALGGGRYAAAVVATLREAYAGGGASFKIADFVALDGGKPGEAVAWKVLNATVPFACSKTVRACFTEQEHKRSKHCLEESSGYLTLQASNPWSFIWHESDWPAHVDKSRRRHQRRHFKPRSDGQLPPEASFCSGPQS